MLLAPALTRAQLAALERSPAVRSVYANRKNPLLMEETTWITKARQVWAAPSAGGLGVTGKGVHLAVIDTGADGQHEDMDNLVEFCETTQAVSGEKVKVDRLYGPQYWEYATLLDAAGTSWAYSWDTLELALGSHALGARSFTQGVGSAKARQSVTLGETIPEGGGKVRICHATGSSDMPYMEMTSSKAAVVHGHLGAKHAGGRDIVPPFEWRGQTYSQNWPAGQAIWENGCRPTG